MVIGKLNIMIMHCNGTEHASVLEPTVVQGLFSCVPQSEARMVACHPFDSRHRSSHSTAWPQMLIIFK